MLMVGVVEETMAEEMVVEIWEGEIFKLVVLGAGRLRQARDQDDNMVVCVMRVVRMQLIASSIDVILVDYGI